jgi:hypothetical protein
VQTNEQPAAVILESWVSRAAALIVMAIVMMFVVDEDPVVLLREPRLTAAVVCGIAVGLWRLLHPARLEIWRRELVWVNMIGFKRRYRFAEIAEFVVEFGHHTQLGFNWKEDSPCRTRLYRILGALNGYDETIFGLWQEPLFELVDRLNRARILPSAYE